MKSAVSTTEIFKYVLLFTSAKLPNTKNSKVVGKHCLFDCEKNKYVDVSNKNEFDVGSKVFKLKNETMSILEKYEGVSNKSIKIINKYLENNAYTTKGTCKKDEYGISDLESTSLEKVSDNNKKYYYCITYNCKNDRCTINSGAKIYYKITLFYKFNLPVIGELLTFKINGETKGIKLYSEMQKMVK